MPSIPLAGATPAGLFIPNDFVPRGEPVGILADAIDIETGELLAIDAGYDPDDAWIINTLRTVRGSGSAVENTGRDFSSVTHVSPEDEADLKQQIRAALKPQLERRAIVITELTVLSIEDAFEVHLAYSRAVDGRERELTLQLGDLIGGSVQ